MSDFAIPVPSSYSFIQNCVELKDEEVAALIPRVWDLACRILDSTQSQDDPWELAWRGHGFSLVIYGLTACKYLLSEDAESDPAPEVKWFQRRLAALQYIMAESKESPQRPEWWGEDSIHNSHRLALLAKDADYEERLTDPVNETGSTALVHPNFGVTRYDDRPVRRDEWTGSTAWCKCKELTSYVPVVIQFTERQPETYWLCGNCGATPWSWFRIAQNFLGDHYFEGGELDGDNMESDLVARLDLFEGYLLASEPGSTFMGEEAFRWDSASR